VAVLAGGARAQTAEGSVSRDRLEVGEELMYTLTLRGGRGQAVGPPLASGALRLVSRQPTLDVTTAPGGQTERRVAWTYEATRPGQGRVGRLGVTVGGRRLWVDAVDVTVRRGPPTPAPPVADPEGEVFVRAVPARRTALVGQQVLVDYVLYFEPSVQPRQTAPIGTWDAAGFWREEMDVPSAYPRPVRLGGRDYEVVVVRRVALFPTRSGALELAPMTFTVDLFRTDRRFADDPFAPFFSPFASRFDEVEVTAPALEVPVRPLPAGAPDTFRGAVGQFELSTAVDARRVRAGEPVELRVTVSGTGNVATVEPPDVAVPAGVDVYGPEAEGQTLRRAEPLRGTKTFTWTLVPQGGGPLEVPPAAWTYFDPATGRYETLRTDPVEVAVEGAPLAAAPTAAPDGPAALLASADWRRPGAGPGWLWVALGGGLALPALAAAALAAARVGRRRRAAGPDRRRRAEARRRLAAARSLPAADAFREADASVRAALHERASVPPTLPLPALAERLGRAGVAPGLRDRALALLDACARGQYAPGLPGAPDAEAVVAEAEAVLAALDDTRAERSPTTSP
jgi:hypothetical protein